MKNAIVALAIGILHTSCNGVGSIQGFQDDAAGGMGTPAGAASAQYIQIFAGPAATNVVSKTWVGIHTAVPDLQDGIHSAGITRANSIFTFARAGVYVVDARLSSISQSGTLYMRIRKINGTPATLLANAVKNTTGSSTYLQPADGLHGLIQVAAGDQAEIQYQVSSQSGAYIAWDWTNNVEPMLGGEPNHTSNISIYSISLD